MMELGAGDVWTAERGAWLFERIVASGSLVLRRLGESRAGEIAAHRFLSSPHVTAAGIVEAFCERTRQASVGRRVVVAQDTTEISFSGRSAGRRGLGPAGDGKTPGFFIHPNVVVDVDEEVVLGLAGARIWRREAAKVTARSARAAEDKESARWLEGSRAAAAALVGHAAQVIGVCDREGDVWSHFAHAPAGMELAIRSRHDRSLENGRTLFEALADRPALAATLVKVAPRGPGDKGRTAKVVLRAARVRIKRPNTAPRDDPPVLEIGFVEAIEHDPPQGARPLAWRILTTLPVDTADQARDVVGVYRLRWRIEEVFREGATAKQKNPHPEGSLAWLSWVVARYGGWNCYGKPPGPKTMAYGWPRFCATLCGLILAKAQENV